MEPEPAEAVREFINTWNKLPESVKQGVRDYECQERIAALEAELAALKDPWIRIDPERPETLPHNYRNVDVSFYRPSLKQFGTHIAQHKAGRWIYCESGEPLPGEPDVIIYAWKERPAPAPYPEGGS